MEKRPPMPPDIELMRLMQAKAQQAEGMPAGQAQPEEIIGFVTTPEPTPKRMTKERLTKALHDLDKYRSGKARLEQRLIEVEQWWKIRHWEWMQEQGAKNDMKTASAWLFNVIVSKHADGVQSIPEANVLPREESDKPTAKMLSSIIPCVLEQNRFDEVYSDVLWQKLKGGTGAYGIFWDKDAHNGLGDISLNRANLLHLYWEPGISDIQDSKQVFYLEKVDEDLLKSQYPELEGENLTGKNITLRKYKTEDSVTDEGKAVVVDWYYHSYAHGRKILHYCKFVNTTVLYATEDDPELADRGLYDHGMYPFVLDALFPVEGSPCGFGYIDVCKNAQEQIDIIDQAIIKNSIINATPRYFIRSDGAVNEIVFNYKKDNTLGVYNVTHYVRSTDGESYVEHTSYGDIGTIGEVIKVDPLRLKGFTYDHAIVNGATTNLTDGTVNGTIIREGLEIKLYYERNKYPYKIQYLDKDTLAVLKSPDVITPGEYYGRVVTATNPPSIENYTLSSVSSCVIVEDDPANPINNVINVYYSEKTVRINYEVVGPDGSGNVNPTYTDVKVLSGTGASSTATANEGYRFVGWYSDRNCTQLVTSNASLFLTIPNDKVWKAATYYAKFEPLASDLTIVRTNATDVSQVYVYEVKNNATGEIYYATIVGNGTATIKHLPMGEYTVTQQNDWSWRHDDSAQSITHASVDGTNVVFSGDIKKDQWLNGNSPLEKNQRG